MVVLGSQEFFPAEEFPSVRSTPTCVYDTGGRRSARHHTRRENRNQRHSVFATVNIDPKRAFLHNSSDAV